MEKLQHCVMAVSAWMTGSKLTLNPSKTEFLLIRTKLQREKFLNNFPWLILGQDTNPSASAKNLCIVFDGSLNFRKHISQTIFFCCDERSTIFFMFCRRNKISFLVICLLYYVRYQTFFSAQIFNKLFF